MLQVPHGESMQEREQSQNGVRERYQRTMLEIHGAFAAGASGGETIAARARAVDELVRGLWYEIVQENPGALESGIALVPIGGYGRSQLFPCSDVDLLILLDSKRNEKEVTPYIRRLSQGLWDSGLRFSPATRKLSECERFNPDMAEFTLSLLDHRFLLGDSSLYDRLREQAIGRLLQRDSKAILARIADLTRTRHAKYGDTLFHLEPNIKDCPGGLRDAHVCGWIEMLRAAQAPTEPAGRGSATAEEEFHRAVEFLYMVRCFLHYRHDRDDNTLDWQAQDAAAATGIGLERSEAQSVDAAYWMRLYFRHARSVMRRVTQMLDELPSPAPRIMDRLPSLRKRREPAPAGSGYRVEQGRVLLDTSVGLADPAHDPDVALRIFATISETGCRLGADAEERLLHALPMLSAHLEEGAALWHPLRDILLGRHAGSALRVMHELGILELLIPEFHGIDALVIRDAYHRYTVDEHTFVLIDTLHALEGPQTGPAAEWTAKFGSLLRDIPHPELLYLGALMHDTGKGRSSGDHARESALLARSVLDRLELDAYESDLVLELIENHLEMSAALRRDIFDAETVEAFASKATTPEALRMLALFTYADISAVHPDALTPWKAENIWRLYMATSNYLDRTVDDERVRTRVDRELVDRIVALVPEQREQVEAYLEGFPERYLRTRTPEQVCAHFQMASRFHEDPVQLDFQYETAVSEITLVTQDRPLLFATMAGVLAAWGMNIVTADAFSNQRGIVVDSFRFTDSFRTLELNASEHQRFVQSVHDVMTGKVSLEKLLSGRRRVKRRIPAGAIERRIDFQDEASSHSTLLQVVAPDVPGLLRALSLALAGHDCNIEVALVDTEGETAIDVFYLTRQGMKLEPRDQEEVRRALVEAIEDTL